MGEFVWMRQEFPWLGYGFLHSVDDGYADALQTDLVRLGFDLVTLRGTSMTTPDDFWTEIKSAFDFPDYFGANWDAFHDSFGDLALPDRTALLWRRADLCAQANLKLFAEGVAILRQTAEAVARFERKQIELVLTGLGSAFASPASV